MSQPTVWQDTLRSFRQHAASTEDFWKQQNFNRLIFSGCGSTYYLSKIAASLFQLLTGIAAQAYPASELVLLPDTVYLPDSNPLLVVISRSGTTTESIEAARAFKAKTGNPFLVITCYEESTLAKEADLALVAHTAKEESLAQTRSFASMTILAQAFAALVAGRDDMDVLDKLLPSVERLLSEYDSLARQLAESKKIERYFFLGSGLQYGIANEAMLKMKEMSLSYSEAFHVLEFRHGPMSMIDESALVVGLLSEEAHKQEAAVLQQMKAQGAQILAIAEEDYGLNLSELGAFVQLQSGLPAWARPIAYLPVLQLMAYYRAMSRGQNPDQPANLSAVITLDSL